MQPPSVSPTVSASHPAWVYKPALQVAVDRFDFSALASVHPTIVPCRTVRCPGSFVHPLPLLRRWLHSVRRHMPEHPSDTPCRTRHRNETGWVLRFCVQRRLQLLNHCMELLASSPIPRSFVASCLRLPLGPSPPPALPGFVSTTSLSTTPNRLACLSRVAS